MRGARTQASRSSGSRPSLRREGSQPTPAQSIGFFFRQTRESLNLSQEQLATLTSGNPGRVSRAMISAVECGRHLPGLEVLLNLTQALHISPTEVLERLELSRTDVETAELTEEQLEAEAGQQFWEGNFRQAVACWDALLRRLEAELYSDSSERDRRIAAIEVRRGTALRRCGATAAARAAVERAITLADGDADTQARAYVVLATLLVQLGRLPLARDASRRAVELADESGETKVQGWAWIVQGEVLHGVGDYREGYRAFLQARRFVKAAGDERHEIQIEGNLGSCLYGLGRYGHARRRYLRAVTLARRQDVPASEALWTVELGRVAFLQSRFEEAYDRAGAALKIAKPREHWVTTFRAEWLRHLVRQQEDPNDPDRHRVAYLRRLFVRIEEHRGIEEVQEFKRVYCPTRATEGEPQ